MSIEMMLSDIIRSKRLDQPQVVISTSDSLHLVALDSVLRAAQELHEGRVVTPTPGTRLLAGGTGVVEDVIRLTKPGDVISFTVSGKLVTANRFLLTPQATAAVKSVMQCGSLIVTVD